MSDIDPALSVAVRKAARALGRHGLVHAYGHCSARIDADRFLVTPSKPPGLTEPGEACQVVPVEGPLPDGILGEVRIHQRIYRTRPEVGGVVRFMSPQMMALAALGLTPKPRHGFGAYFAPAPALWDDPQLVRDDDKAAGVVAALGSGRAVMMRGNGAVTAGETLQKAVGLAFYLEDACRVELEALRTGLAETAPLLDADEARLRATDAGMIFERLWDYLTAGDPE
ncbi:HCOMODA/2-hydroxy-3-carboxy-muconic semialdehyde decarboxylase [Rhodobium orientis]|uniref:Class II aldolase n=1 Tax=Rhodobium orientis TaxID=34017 RepID=A0A327JH10_9HYPH|nr:class II aldolase/adducin family protein [Rhodobium orientis]MBB4301884.1 HCOMODA/2-hydroxy-3-carboxy-muconic semialdehyde decarboxylase [Rhodobium orientis]MBK5950122.1 class II aldolase [Rhodobium orientis]RAI25697.1 class II aldolase [Rhodobium orientis]